MTAQLHSTTARVTTIATIFLPLICVAALMGMNSDIIGLSPAAGFAVGLVALAIIAGIVMMVTGREG
jgi:Mg2+ and Co2+ transporter CorA